MRWCTLALALVFRCIRVFLPCLFVFFIFLFIGFQFQLHWAKSGVVVERDPLKHTQRRGSALNLSSNDSNSNSSTSSSKIYGSNSSSPNSSQSTLLFESVVDLQLLDRIHPSHKVTAHVRHASMLMCPSLRMYIASRMDTPVISSMYPCIYLQTRTLPTMPPNTVLFYLPDGIYATGDVYKILVSLLCPVLLCAFSPGVFRAGGPLLSFVSSSPVIHSCTRSTLVGRGGTGLLPILMCRTSTWHPLRR